MLPAITERDLAILSIESQHWRHEGTKLGVVRDQLEMSSTAYYHRLQELLDHPEALAAEPATVNRLRRLRAKRQELRSARRLGPPAPPRLST